LFLKASKLNPAIACVLDVIQNVRMMKNDLRLAAVVVVEREGTISSTHKISPARS
jgi:hypothetical protein